MALISILAKSPHILNWEYLFLKIEDLLLDEIEIFPIPAELGFDENAFGISVSANYKSKNSVETQVQNLVELFTLNDFKMIELYGGITITEVNLPEILSRLLSH
jgi:hypothetical protein